MREEKFLALGSPLAGREVGQDRGELQSLRRELQQPEQRGSCTGSQCRRPARPSLRHAPTGAGTQASDIRPGRGLRMAMQKLPRLAGIGLQPQLRVCVEEVPAALGARRHCLRGA